MYLCTSISTQESKSIMSMYSFFQQKFLECLLCTRHFFGTRDKAINKANHTLFLMELTFHWREANEMPHKYAFCLFIACFISPQVLFLNINFITSYFTKLSYCFSYIFPFISWDLEAYSHTTYKQQSLSSPFLFAYL